MVDSPQLVTATAEQSEMVRKLQGIFMPYAVRKRTAMIEREGRFVHYTSAANALEIIKTKKVWMRNTNCMSDYSEIQHGFDTLNKFFSNAPKRDSFLAALDSCIQGVGQEGLTLFNQWWNDIRFNTYISSMSEHWDDEDQHGRLSMWRAFTRGGARVALVLKLPLADEMAAASLNLLLSPVAYYTEAQVESELQSVINNIKANFEFLRAVDRRLVLATVFYMLVTSVICLKHEGFDEEEEWRLIYSPKQRPSPLILSSIEVIDGIPQMIYKVPLEGGAPDLSAINIPRLLDRVIIGPSIYPWPMYEAFVAALTAAGVADAGARVCVSGIPIRS